MIEAIKILPYLPMFRLVIEKGSFQGAAAHLSLPRSSVSKKIQQLEVLVGQRLIQRTTRQLVLTEAGEHLLTLSQNLPQLLSQLETFSQAQQTEPTGVVKISSSTLLAQQCILPHLTALKARFPKVTIELNLDDNYVDLIATRVDIAIRIGHLPDSNLVARKIGEKSMCVAASPDYLQRHGTPQTPDQLSQHHCIIFKSRENTHNHWPFRVTDGATITIDVTASLYSDDARSLLALACQGFGIVRVDPAFIAEELQTGKLVRILQRYDVDDVLPIQLVCLSRDSRSRASMAVWEYLASMLPNTLLSLRSHS
ncbi:LysR family transcriptional regulator [Thaumasiovibrio subtropicus]|uniref:LysR family transcriptional regulator n=1 Tax=Thaumasiovibrio subtropicus TaxID=1891207 RepID=UPI000B3624BC|nr:LysR family transcriptional regulator [Thaumasiovibrio subtropicus]